MDTARIWFLRVNDAHFSDWDAFTAWLEADSSNLAAYEAVVADDQWAKSALASDRVAANDQAVGPARRWHRAWGAGLAATLCGVVLWFGVMAGPDLAEVSTNPGETREIAFGDGSSVIVNGNSLVSYDPDEPRKLSLERGEALFRIQHDEANPFIVLAGNTRLVDAGTVFNVASDGGALDVAVAEGAVIYQAGGSDITLHPGDRLTRASAAAAPQVARADTAAIGSWHEGLLQYDNAPLAAVARDLSRRLGKPVRVAAGASGLRYTGTISTTGDPRAMLGAASALLGVTITETANDWEMTPADATSR